MGIARRLEKYPLGNWKQEGLRFWWLGALCSLEWNGAV
jgi:hypothetical protein